VGAGVLGLPHSELLLQLDGQATVYHQRVTGDKRGVG
jgi:hypothetical protein